MTATNYFRNPFRSLCSITQLVEYTVMDIEQLDDPTTAAGPKSQKHLLADVFVVRSSDIGSVSPIHSRTHLGHLLNHGDLVLGFDVNNANLNEPNFEKYLETNDGKLFDVILVKKYYGDKSRRNKNRKWKLKHLNDMQADEESTERAEADLVDFMEDLEEDPMLRQNVNIYKDERKLASTMPVDLNDLDHDAVPQITLEEMLEDLAIE